LIRPTLPVALLGGLLLSVCGCAHPRALPSLPEAPASIPGYLALLNARTSGGEGSARGRVAAAFLAPARLRLEILDPAGGTRAVLVAAEGGALYLDPPRRSFRAYETDAAALQALVGIAASPGLLARLILGPAAAVEGLACSGEGSKTCPLPQGGEIRLLGSQPPAAEIRDPRSGTIQVRWEKVTEASRGIPRSTELKLLESGASLRLELVDLRFTEPEASLFSLDPPAGFQSGAVSAR
jgi:hypothetical protein